MPIVSVVALFFRLAFINDVLCRCGTHEHGGCSTQSSRCAKRYSHSLTHRHLLGLHRSVGRLCRLVVSKLVVVKLCALVCCVVVACVLIAGSLTVKLSFLVACVAVRIVVNGIFVVHD